MEESVEGGLESCLNRKGFGFVVEGAGEVGGGEEVIVKVWRGAAERECYRVFMIGEL